MDSESPTMPTASPEPTTAAAEFGSRSERREPPESTQGSGAQAATRDREGSRGPPVALGSAGMRAGSRDALHVLGESDVPRLTGERLRPRIDRQAILVCERELGG